MSESPTVVLVHGAFAESSSWSGVLAHLQAKGVAAIATPNPLRSVTTDADNVRRAVESVGGPVLLVGHSYGGAVITEAAVGSDVVKGLVYVAAFAPDHGETALGLTGQFPGSTLGETVRPYPAGRRHQRPHRRPRAVPEPVRRRRAARGRARSPPPPSAPSATTRSASRSPPRLPRGRPCRRGSSSAPATRTSPSRACGSWPSAPAR